MNAVELRTGKHILCVVRDITERKQAERELQESRRALATLMSTLPGMAYRCEKSMSWTMELASSGCRELTGYEPDELVANRVVAFGDLIVADDRRRGRELVRSSRSCRR